MRRNATIAVVIVAVLGGAVGVLALIAGPRPDSAAAPQAKPAWTEMPWPFPMDQWGRGKAFACKPEACGAEVRLYLRAKVGFCDCVSDIDDDEVDRVGDFDLVGGDRAALGSGRPIEVRWMKGRSRAYALSAAATPPSSALAVAFHDHCDMIVATAVIGGEQPAAQEGAVLELLNSDRVLRWAEVTLGL
jgi:hypothetical protein